MVKVKINGTEYRIKTKWDEVEPDRLMSCDDYKQELACMTDIPLEIIEKASESQIFPIYSLITFIDETDRFPDIQAVDIEKESYQKLELTKSQIQSGKTYTRVLKAGRIYYPDEKDVVRLLGLGVNIINQISVFLENYKEMISAEPDADEVWAGVETLSDFGAWGTAYVLADRNILNLQAVLDTPALRVYEALRYNFREAKYMKRLYEVKNKKP